MQPAYDRKPPQTSHELVRACWSCLGRELEPLPNGLVRCAKCKATGNSEDFYAVAATVRAVGRKWGR